MDAEGHLSRTLLLDFFNAAISPAERQQVVRHLLSRCERCRELAEKAWLETVGLRTIKKPREDHGGLRISMPHLTAFEALMAREKAAAPGLWSLLRDIPRDRLFPLLRKPELHSLGLVEHILNESFDTAPTDPKRAIEIARIALELLDLLHPETYGACLLADSRARACGALANAWRIAGELEQARDLLETGFDLLADGTGDLLEKARLLSLLASLEIDTGELEAANRTLAQAAKIYESINDRHLLGKTRIQQAWALVHIQPAAALARASEGLARIDPSDARTHLSGVHTTIIALNALGRPHEAFTKLQQNERLYKQFPDEFTQLQLRAVQARIAARLGLIDEAMEVYGDVAQGLEKIGEHQGMVLARIEHIQLLLARGLREPALEIARACTPVLESRGLRNDLLSMWGALSHALEEDLVRAEILQRATDYFVRYWSAPPAHRSPRP